MTLILLQTIWTIMKFQRMKVSIIRSQQHRILVRLINTERYFCKNNAQVLRSKWKAGHRWSVLFYQHLNIDCKILHIKLCHKIWQSEQDLQVKNKVYSWYVVFQNNILYWGSYIMEFDFKNWVCCILHLQISKLM